MVIYNKDEITAALNENVNAFNNFILSLTEKQFEYAKEGKWSAGQNLEHLIRSIQPLQIAFRLPKFVLKLLFGAANRQSRTYDTLVEKYKSKLAAGGKALGRYVPQTIFFEKRHDLVRKYDLEKEKLIDKIKKQKEEQLDTYILPHPLIGKITLREMLFFTIYHNEHHLAIIKARSEI